MKKLLSLLLVLSLLLGLSACVSSQAPTEPQLAVGESTEPLFWPPIPTGTEETEPLPGFTHVPEEREETPQQPNRPVYDSDRDDQQAGYVPRDEEETRPAVVEPIDPTENDPTPQETVPPTTAPASTLDPNGTYDSKTKVALFIVTYGRLPNNYITKSQAERLGWDGGSVERYAPGKCIGGDRFYNNEGLLPSGYTYYECDIGTLGAGSRGAQRLVYTKTGIVYYTSNHYKSFTRLY